MDEFAALVTAESRGLVAAVTAIVGDRHRAEEIVQDAFERCFLRWRRVARMDRPGAWVRRVAINGAISDHRRRGAETRALRRLAKHAATGGSGPEPFDALGDDDLWATVRALPGEQAAAVALRYGADLTTDEVAAALDLSPQAVKSLLHRARTTLRGSDAVRDRAAGGDRP